ncbi:phage tail protein [Streptomyces sp. NPDC055025]
MPAGQVIGRISVRVLPDTSDFKEEAKTQLRRIEQQLTVTISTKIDTTGARKGVLEAVRDINRDNKVDSRKIRFYTRIATDGMATAVRQAARELQSRANSQKVAFKVDDLKAHGKIELELDQRSADRAKQKIKDWLDGISPLTVPVKLDIANGTGAAISARLQILTRPRTVPIVPELDNTAVLRVATALAALSGARVLNSMFEKLGNTLRNLDKSVPIIGSLALAIAGLAGWGLSAASNLAALSASLASIGSTTLLLPGLLGGIAVGLGVTIAAFRDFNTILPEVKAALSGLQDTISKNFWAKAAEPIRTMADELLPEFTAGVAQTGTQLGGFFADFAASLKGALNPALTQMFTDLSASITVAATGTGAFANSIAVLGQVGTSYLPALAQWFVDISTRFSDFLTKSEGNGNLKGWIDEGIQALKDLGSVLLNVGGILAGIARAAEAAGGSSLGMMADTLERIHSTVDSAGFQAGLIGVFRGAHAAMNAIATQSGPAVKELLSQLAQLAETILPQVGQIIGTALSAVANGLNQPGVMGGVHALFDGIQAAVTGLAPAMAPLGQALGALMTLVGAFAAMLGPLAAAALVPLAQAFAALAPSIVPIVQLLGGALTTAVQALAPIVAQLVPVVGAMLAAAFGLLQAVLPVVAQLFQQIVTAVAPLVTQLISGLGPILPVIAGFIAQVLAALTPVVSILIEIVSAVITPLIPMLQSIVSAILPPLADAFQRVAEAVQPLLEALLAVVDFLMPVLVPVIQFVIQVLGGALVACINGVALVLEGFVEFFKGVWNTVKGVFEIFWGLFEGIFTGNWDTFKQGFEDLWDGILGMLKGIWDAILGALEVFLNLGILGLAGKALKAIRALWDAAWGGIRMAGVVIWDAIKTAFTGFGSTLSSLGSSMMSGLRQLFSAGWEAIKSAAGSAMSALGRVISTGVTNAIKFVKELPGEARSALTSLGSTLVSAGKALIQGLIDGITSMFSAVKDKLGSLTSKLTDWKGPESLDRVLLVGAGQLVVDGFIKGLESRYDAVRKSLRGLTDEVADTSFALPGVRQTGASHAINTALSSALNARSEGCGTTRVLNYYAAPGASLSGEEDLFAAANRARMGW